MKRDTQGKLAAMFTANMEDEDTHPLEAKFAEVEDDPLQMILNVIKELQQEGEE